MQEPKKNFRSDENRFIYNKQFKYLRTPKDIWQQLSKEFNFTIDCCASDQNHLLPMRSL